jgi:hypothetical protein
MKSEKSQCAHNDGYKHDDQSGAATFAGKHGLVGCGLMGAVAASTISFQ